MKKKYIMKDKTLYQSVKDLQYAWSYFILTVIYELKIDKLFNWLENKLNNYTEKKMREYKEHEKH